MINVSTSQLPSTMGVKARGRGAPSFSKCSTSISRYPSPMPPLPFILVIAVQIIYFVLSHPYFFPLFFLFCLFSYLSFFHLLLTFLLSSFCFSSFLSPHSLPPSLTLPPPLPFDSLLSPSALPAPAPLPLSSLSSTSLPLFLLPPPLPPPRVVMALCEAW